DLFGAADQLPVLDNGERDVVFMIWLPNARYLPIIKSYYPGSELKSFSFHFRPEGPELLFKYYVVKKEQIDQRRTAQVTYTPASGSPVEQEEHGLGTTVKPPASLTYPAQAEWHTQLLA